MSKSNSASVYGTKPLNSLLSALFAIIGLDAIAAFAFAVAVGSVSSVATKPVSAPASSAGGQQGGAALASSVAAVGIGIGMVGAAAASLMAAVARLSGMQLLISVACLIALVSLPSVILTWFKLRRRDLGAVLNASGWAVNHPLRLALALVLLSLGGTALA